jgi:TonB family protein
MNTPYWFSNLAYWSAQLAVLALAAGFLPLLFRIRQPRVLLVYWRALVVICLLLPFAQPWQRQSNFGTITIAPRFGEAAQIVSATSGPAVNRWYLTSASTIAAIIGVVILAGIAARFTILALGLLKLRQFRRASSPIADHAASSAVLDEMRVRVNTGGEFRISSDVDSPVTFGLSAPVILLPERFPTLDAQYQAAIACHELLHVRRSDWAHHLSEEILRAALWFHPAIAWFIARIRLSREQVVDLEVVRLTDARKSYLEALLEFTSSRALAAAIPAPPFLGERQLAERVALMLKEVRMSRTRLVASLTAIAACLALVATLAIWTFPLKAAPQYSLPPIQNPGSRAIHFVPDGILGGVAGGVTQGISGGVINGKIEGVPGGISGGVQGGIKSTGPTQGVKDGISGGVTSAVITDRVTGKIIGTATTGPDGVTRIVAHDMQPNPRAIPASTSVYQNVGGKIYRAGEDGVSMPKCEYCPKPEYSEEARSTNLSGTIRLQVVVLANGHAGDIKVLTRLGKGLDEQAVNTVRDKWTFKPAVDSNGDPVDVIVPVEISFQLFAGTQSGTTAFVHIPSPPVPPQVTAPSTPGGVPTPPTPPSPASLKSAEGINLKIFTAPVSGNGESTPFYMGRVKTETLYAPQPEFPRFARQNKIYSGTVTLNIIVDTGGNVIAVQADKFSSPMFVQAAIDTVRKWKIKGTHDGVPVTFQVPVEITFNSM